METGESFRAPEEAAGTSAWVRVCVPTLIIIQDVALKRAHVPTVCPP